MRARALLETPCSCPLLGLLKKTGHKSSQRNSSPTTGGRDGGGKLHLYGGKAEWAPSKREKPPTAWFGIGKKAPLLTATPSTSAALLFSPWILFCCKRGGFCFHKNPVQHTVSFHDQICSSREGRGRCHVCLIRYYESVLCTKALKKRYYYGALINSNLDSTRFQLT